jgi:hypothetical protein
MVEHGLASFCWADETIRCSDPKERRGPVAMEPGHWPVTEGSLWRLGFSFTRLRLRQRANFLAFWLSVFGLVRLTVCETLAFCAFQRERRTFPVFDFASVPFEIPFNQVTGQMGF